MASTVDLVCFDWGGVILRICRSWQEACARAGIAFDPLLADPDRVAARRELSAAYQLGHMACGAYFEALAATTGHRYTAADVQRVHDAWLIEEYPGIESPLARLASGGIVTGLLSNTNHRHWVRQRPGEHGLPAFGAVLHLTHRHASHVMGFAKPGRDIYEQFAATVGVRPASILFFDDLEENVQAARSAGWQAECIDHTGDTAAQIERLLRHHGVC